MPTFWCSLGLPVFTQKQVLLKYRQINELAYDHTYSYDIIDYLTENEAKVDCVCVSGL